MLHLHKAFDSVDHDVRPDRYSPGKISRLEVQLQACSFIKKVFILRISWITFSISQILWKGFFFDIYVSSVHFSKKFFILYFTL